MRTAKEKEKILNEYFINYKSLKQISIEYNIDLRLLKTWRKKYQTDGINGLVSKNENMIVLFMEDIIEIHRK